jgi:predicted glutamine amidotransferase
MCGIIYVQSNDEAKTRQLLEYQYYHQRSRGKRGFGLVNLSTGEVFKEKDEDDILQKVVDTDSKQLLFHHRFPTSTENTVESAHPFRVSNKKYDLLVVHNGVVNNPREVLEKLNKKPHKMSSFSEGKFNDSEALAYDFLDAITTGRKKLYSAGSMAIIAYDKANNCLWLYRNSRNPLVYYRQEDMIMIASEAPIDNDIKEGILYRFSIESSVLGECRKLDFNDFSIFTKDKKVKYPRYSGIKSNADSYKDHSWKHNHDSKKFDIETFNEEELDIDDYCAIQSNCQYYTGSMCYHRVCYEYCIDKRLEEMGVVPQTVDSKDDSEGDSTLSVVLSEADQAYFLSEEIVESGVATLDESDELADYISSLANVLDLLPEGHKDYFTFQKRYLELTEIENSMYSSRHIEKQMGVL